jgi:RluA family pseudouridine synthase
LETLYEDSDCLVVAKPAGFAVIPGRDEKPEDALRGQLEAQRSERLWVVHRLDRDTSGALVFARNEKTHRLLSMAFEAREVAKVYVAWTLGVPTPASGEITVPLHPARKGRMRPALPGEDGALPSSTDYRVERTAKTLMGELARIEARPQTGRQHQIRVHLRAAGAALLIDPIYARREAIAAGDLGPGAPAMSRLTLHARSVSFQMPKGTVSVLAPLPPDLDALDGWMEAHRSG